MANQQSPVLASQHPLNVNLLWVFAECGVGKQAKVSTKAEKVIWSFLLREEGYPYVIKPKTVCVPEIK